jgi:hypothetical protein
LPLPAPSAPVLARRSRRRGHPRFQRAADAEIPGAIVIERNRLEWRLAPAGLARIPEASCHHAGIDISVSAAAGGSALGHR